MIQKTSKSHMGAKNISEYINIGFIYPTVKNKLDVLIEFLLFKKIIMSKFPNESFSEKELKLNFIDGVFNDCKYSQFVNTAIYQIPTFKELHNASHKSASVPKLETESGDIYKDPKHYESSKLEALELYKACFLWDLNKEKVPTERLF